MKIVFDTVENIVAGYADPIDYVETTRYVLADPATDWNEAFLDYSKLSNGVVTVDVGKYAASKHSTVNATARSRLENLAWRIERAQERDKIGAEGESVGEVLAEREAIRRASNRAETELEALTTIEEIEAFAWEVLPSDYPSNPVVTRLGFMRRFTDAERASIRAARDSGQSQDLLDFWELLQLATNVNLNDTDIKLGVDMLETEGLIGTGRATEVLTV